MYGRNVAHSTAADSWRPHDVKTLTFTAAHTLNLKSPRHNSSAICVLAKWRNHAPCHQQNRYVRRSGVTCTGTPTSCRFAADTVSCPAASGSRPQIVCQYRPVSLFVMRLLTVERTIPVLRSADDDDAARAAAPCPTSVLYMALWNVIPCINITSSLHVFCLSQRVYRPTLLMCSLECLSHPHWFGLNCVQSVLWTVYSQSVLWIVYSQSVFWTVYSLSSEVYSQYSELCTASQSSEVYSQYSELCTVSQSSELCTASQSSELCTVSLLKCTVSILNCVQSVFWTVYSQSSEVYSQYSELCTVSQSSELCTASPSSELCTASQSSWIFFALWPSIAEVQKSRPPDRPGDYILHVGA